MFRFRSSPAVIPPRYHAVPFRRATTRHLPISACSARVSSLFTLVRVDPLRVITDIPESESSSVRIGQPVTLSVDALTGQQFAGRIERIAGVLEPKSRTLRVEIELTDATDALRPGMYGAAAITLADYPQALQLPAQALGRDGAGYFVMCMEDGFARKRPVTVVYNDGARAIVTEGSSARCNSNRSPLRNDFSRPTHHRQCQQVMPASTSSYRSAKEGSHHPYQFMASLTASNTADKTL